MSAALAAALAPAAVAGAGRILEAVTGRGATAPAAGAPPATGMPVRQSNVRQKTTRRTNLLSLLSPHERQAFLQEQLDQAAIFRQIACAKNGVPGPTERNVIGPAPSVEEIEQAATETGISTAEMQRREDLSRREAMVSVREEVIRVQATQPDDPLTPDSPPTDVEPPISAEEARRREDLAHREAANREAEQVLARQQTADVADQAERERQDELRRTEQRTEDERRDQLEADRQQAHTDRLAEIEAEATRRREADEERRRQAATAATDAEADRQRVHDERMAELAANAQGGDATVNVTTPPTTTPPRRISALAGGGMGAAALALSGLLGWSLLPDDTKPVDSNPGTEVTAPVDGAATPPIVTTDAQTLLLLQSKGLAAPQTPLGVKILEAFELDPSLREKVMQDVERTLLNKESKGAIGEPDE